jgi:itaconate CoA-transferase
MRHHFVTPYGPYKAGDGVYVNIAVATAQDWKTFCRNVMERPDLVDDARFNTSERRRANRALLEGMIEEIFLQRPHQEWLRRLEERRLPYGLVRGIGEVLAHPQVPARGLIQQVDSPVGPVPVIASALHLPDSPARLDAIPSLGGDTEAILKELGYSEDRIGRLRADGAI